MNLQTALSKSYRDVINKKKMKMKKNRNNVSVLVLIFVPHMVFLISNARFVAGTLMMSMTVGGYH